MILASWVFLISLQEGQWPAERYLCRKQLWNPGSLGPQSLWTCPPGCSVVGRTLDLSAGGTFGPSPEALQKGKSMTRGFTLSSLICITDISAHCHHPSHKPPTHTPPAPGKAPGTPGHPKSSSLSSPHFLSPTSRSTCFATNLYTWPSWVLNKKLWLIIHEINFERFYTRIPSKTSW